MKYLAIVNNEDIKVVEEILNSKGISFYAYDSAEDRFLIENACDALDVFLGENNLSADDISSFEEKILDETVDKVKSSDDFYNETESILLETVKEVASKTLEMETVNEWAKDLDCTNSVIMEIRSIIESFYNLRNTELLSVYNQYNDSCSLWRNREEFISYLETENQIKVTEPLDNLFELSNGLFLACM